MRTKAPQQPGESEDSLAKPRLVRRSMTGTDLRQWRKARSVFRKKFVVVIYGEESEDFRLFERKDAALGLYSRAAEAAHGAGAARVGSGTFEKIRWARLYEVVCDDEECARERIANFQARLIHDSANWASGIDIDIPDLFRTVH